MKNLFILSLLLSAQAAFAGSATAVVKCQSASGRTQVETGDDDFTSSMAYAELSVDGKTLSYNLEKNPSAMYSVYDFKNKVFTQVIVNTVTHEEIRLYAIPSSLKIESGNNRTHGTFDGILSGNDPRNKEDFIRNIKVKCRVDYSI